jgi:CubicO group peptidase (beta-lactamase class C family)
MASLFLFSCGSPQTTAPEPFSAPESLNDGLQTARPRDVALAEDILAPLVQRLQTNAIRNLHSLLILRHDRLVVEEYFNGSNRNDVHTLQSVTKSVTSLLIGAAIQRQSIRGVEEPVVNFFSEYINLQNVDDRKTRMTLRHLLTMQTGLNWNEEPYAGSHLETLNNSCGDWVPFVLNRPMREAPGTRWQYNSGGVIVLSGMLRYATQMFADQLARRVLFEPLGIQNERWYRAPCDGLPHTGGGLSLRARDMAKLGQLVLRRGRWGEQQIISAAWLTESFQRAAAPGYMGNHPVYYGYLWWLLPLSGRAGPIDADGDIITASGAGSQWTFIIPQHDLVVAVTGNGYNGADWIQPVDFLYADILRAVQN